MAWQHISDHDLDRYYLGIVADESELAPFEEHLLACPICVQRSEETQDYVDTIRAVLSAPSVPSDCSLFGFRRCFWTEIAGYCPSSRVRV